MPSLKKSTMKTSNFFDDEHTPILPESESKVIGACAICDPEFDVKTSHRSVAQSLFNVMMSPLTILKVGPFVAKGLMYGIEWSHYKFWYVLC